MKIINLTQHRATPAQVEAGVIDSITPLADLLTFETLPSRAELETRAETLATIAREARAQAAMIGGAPYFMSYLEVALRQRGITPLYAFSVRRSTETHNADGSVSKAQVFEHAGFVEGRT